MPFFIYMGDNSAYLALLKDAVPVTAAHRDHWNRKKELLTWAS
jgi:hypothetical protein